MAIYVTSDAHGHVRALDEALSKISLTSDDTLYVLGDMIDRGPDPVGVIRLVRSLPNAHVLKGNHEQIMLDAIIGQDPLDAETWDINGGWTTREQLNDMEYEAYEELVRWMAALPLYAVVETEERPYLLVHAGIEMKAARAFLLEHGVDCADGVGAVGADRELLQQMLAVQSSDDLLGFVTAIGMCRPGCFLPRARAGRGERPHAHGIAWALLRGRWSGGAR